MNRFAVVLFRVGLWLCLCTGVTANGSAEPFSWQGEALFQRLESEFLAVRGLSADELATRFLSLESEAKTVLQQLKPHATVLPELSLQRLETLQFEMGVIAAAHPVLLARLQQFTTALRQQLLPASDDWQADAQRIHQLLYRLIYGGRLAVEEAWLQSEADTLPSLLHLADVQSQTTSAMVQGVRVYSGDILLSRAGAATSALISRGNDYQGQFSHVALLYIDEETKTPHIIEAHIEIGVVVSSLEQYLQDKKQRILVLRLNPNHPKLAEKPNLAHSAAKRMYQRAQESLIPYDFAMDYAHDDKLFCSEVVYHAYREEGVDLWRIKTLMSQPGLQAWLADMGVKFFETLAPSDIAYDSQLQAVAEWRDLTILKEDRIDSALMDGLLEEAEQGLRLDYPLYKLPVATAVKIWSGVESMFGFKPVIPKGMHTTAALKVSSLMEKIFPLLRQRLRHAQGQFLAQQGYMPPYWSLMKLSRQVVQESLPELSTELVRHKLEAAR